MSDETAVEGKEEKVVDHVAEYLSKHARLRSLQENEQADPEAADKEQRKLRKQMRDHKAKMTAAQVATLPEMGRGRKTADGEDEGGSGDKPAKAAKTPKKAKATKKTKARVIDVEAIIGKLTTAFALEDRRSDPTASQASGYGFSLKSSSDVVDPEDDDDTAAGKLADAFFQKFQERWDGVDPTWVTVFPQGKDKMIVLGPIPGSFTEDEEDDDSADDDVPEADDDWDDAEEI